MIYYVVFSQERWFRGSFWKVLGSSFLDHFPLFRVWDSIAKGSGGAEPVYPSTCYDEWKLMGHLRPEGSENKCLVSQDAPMLTVPLLASSGSALWKMTYHFQAIMRGKVCKDGWDHALSNPWWSSFGQYDHLSLSFVWLLLYRTAV